MHSWHIAYHGLSKDLNPISSKNIVSITIFTPNLETKGF
jgi:hypothetical protein